MQLLCRPSASAEGYTGLQEDLDAEMDAYFMKDSKTAVQRLDNDLDDYFKTKPAETEAEAEAEVEAAPEPIAEGEGAKS